MQSATTSIPAVVPGGVVDLRSRIRRRATSAGVALPLVLGVVATALLRGSDDPWRGALGTVAALLAAPLLPLAGGPLAATGPLLLAVVASGALWAAVGWLAARRALRGVVADWSDYRREWCWLAVPLWCGEFVGLLAFGSTLV